MQNAGYTDENVTGIVKEKDLTGKKVFGEKESITFVDRTNEGNISWIGIANVLTYYIGKKSMED